MRLGTGSYGTPVLGYSCYGIAFIEIPKSSRAGMNGPQKNTLYGCGFGAS